MARYRSKLAQAIIALVLLAMSAMLWPSLGTSATYASATRAMAPAACPTPSNNACITSINSTPTIGVTLNGTDQNLSFNLLFTLNNSVKGNWHVTIALTQFQTTSIPQRTLSTTSSLTSATVVSSCTGSTCPGNAISYPLSVATNNSPVTFFNNTAGGNHGVGTFTILTTLNITVPGNAFAGTYTSTVTITFVSGSP